MSPDGLERLGPLVSGVLGKGMPDERRVASVWIDVVGEEVGRNAQPRSLRNGRLVVATSSSVWAQTLQLMGDQIRARLNEALARPLVGEMVFRPAGWDPGGGHAGPRPLGSPAPGLPGGAGWAAIEERGDDRLRASATQKGSPEHGALGPGRPLTAEEEAAVEEVRRLACDEVLGQQIADAMRACLERGGPLDEA